MRRGRVRQLSLVASVPPFGVAAYLLIEGQGPTAAELALIVVAGLLALRGVGLTRTRIEADPGERRVRLDTEFEGPLDEGPEDDD